MVQREALSTPECQEGVPSQGGQQREEHRDVHQVQDTFKRSKCEYIVQIVNVSTPECQETVPTQGGQQMQEHRVVHHDQVECFQGHF